MSFILDALRKSEHARQKQTGPGLAEVPVAVARPRQNLWATAAVALLVVNLVAVGVVLLRKADDGARPGAADAPSRVAPSPATPPAITEPTGRAAVTTPRDAGSEPTLSPPPAAAAQPREPAARPAPGGVPTGRNPLAEEVGEAASADASLAAGAASVPRGPPAVTQRADATARRGSVVYAPVPEAADAPEPAPATRPAPAAGETLPTAEEVTARGGLPALHLDLHVYASSPQQRFVFVNSRKYREGETLQEGPLVEQITPSGAVLSFRGSRFRLSND